MTDGRQIIAEEVLGNLADSPLDGWQIDQLSLSFDQTHKRILRLNSAAGVDVGLRLSEEQQKKGLNHGDILFCDQAAHYALTVAIIPHPCLVLEAENPLRFAQAAYAIGNRHSPLYCGRKELELLVPEEALMGKMLAEMGFVWRQEMVRLSASMEFLAGVGHGAHGHSHD